MAPAPEKEFTEAEVAKHNTAEDCWLIIGNENTGKCFNFTACIDAVSICGSLYVTTRMR